MHGISLDLKLETWVESQLELLDRATADGEGMWMPEVLHRLTLDGEGMCELELLHRLTLDDEGIWCCRLDATF